MVSGDNFQFSPTLIIYAGNDMSDEVMKGKGFTEQKIGKIQFIVNPRVYIFRIT